MSFREISHPRRSPLFPDKIVYEFSIACFLSALFVDGLGNELGGVAFPTNISTVFIFGALFIQISTGVLRAPKLLLGIYTYILVQTFLVNYTERSAGRSLTHFIALVLFSITAFNYVSIYRERITDIIRKYYGFCFLLACLAILQVTTYILFGESVTLQAIVGGLPPALFAPEILGIFPRAIATLSEPATYAVTALPGAYVALLVLAGRADTLRLRSKSVAVIVLTGFLLSFSLVGFFGLALSVTLIALTAFKKHRVLATFGAALMLFGGYLVLSQLEIWTKLESGFEASQQATDYQYTSADLSGFALISNALVAERSLIDSHYLGSGLNTHQDSYDDFISSLFSNTQLIIELNKTDAGSLFIRVASEFGIPGLIALVYFLLHYKVTYAPQGSSVRVVNDISLVFLITYAARNGSYLSISLWLFAALYVYTHQLARRAKASVTTA